MSQQRDIERLLDLWLEEGSTVAPDRVLDVVADRIERQRQRFGWPPFGGTSNVNIQFRLAAAVAALAIIGAGTLYLIGRSQSGFGGPRVTPSTSASASPSESLRTITSTLFRPTVTIDTPARWQKAPEDDARAFRLTTNGNEATGTPRGEIEFRANPVIATNANSCEGLAASDIGTSVSEIVAGLSADPRLAVVTAGTVTLDGRVGQMLDIRLAPGWTGSCPWSSGQPAGLLLTVPDPPGPFTGLAGNERTRVILLDVDGVVVSITMGTFDTPYSDAFVAEAMPMVETTRFTP